MVKSTRLKADSLDKLKKGMETKPSKTDEDNKRREKTDIKNREIIKHTTASLFKNKIIL